MITERDLANTLALVALRDEWLRREALAQVAEGPRFPPWEHPPPRGDGYWPTLARFAQAQIATTDRSPITVVDLADDLAERAALVREARDQAEIASLSFLDAVHGIVTSVGWEGLVYPEERPGPDGLAPVREWRIALAEPIYRNGDETWRLLDPLRTEFGARRAAKRLYQSLYAPLIQRIRRQKEQP